MSQHYFPAKSKDGRSFEVLTGWDRPLHGFFLVIEEVGSEDDDHIFSNLNAPPGVEMHPKTYDRFKEFMDSVGVELPPGLMDALQEDKRTNAGNTQKKWLA